MSNWEYKIISSGKGGFASPALMEKFLNDLGQEHWEILNFQTLPDNPLAFSGLARRRTERDWTLEDAAKAAAKAEADKLRAEFEAKFKAGNSIATSAASSEDQAATFLAEEKTGHDDGFRRLRDTSRDDDPDAHDEETAPKDEWDQLTTEDELPAFFDAIRPHMRRNQRGPGLSVGVDYLAKKWRLEESDIKNALVECGLQIPADENARPVHVEYEGELFWVNINRRGEIWINTREKPTPVFRIVPGKRLEEPAEESPAAPTESEPPANTAPAETSTPAADTAPTSAPKTFLGKIRGLMRRNRRGHGWSGSFPFLTKALRTDEAGLLAQLATHGLTLAPEGAEKPAFHEEEGFLYWMQRSPRGEVWINAQKARAPRSENAHPEATMDGEPTVAADTAPETAETSTSAIAPVENSLPSPTDTLAAVRLLLQPKKRGEGVAALISDIANQLGQPQEKLLAALQQANVIEPADEKAKPTFGEHADEIFWLNRNAKGELWLNAKPAKSKPARRARSGKKDSAD